MIKMQVVCFIDIVKYSIQEKVKGHDAVQKVLDEYLKIGEIFVNQNKGTEIKKIGDAHLATFDFLESALSFATEMQQYYQEQECVDREIFPIRITLCLGAVDPKENDVFGRAVIQASRQETVTSAGNVTVNKALVDEIGRVWGKEKTELIFSSIGEFDLPGIGKKEELFIFRWDVYAENNMDGTLAGHVYKCLDEAQMTFFNINKQDLSPPGTIIWPVVPREIVTAIHRGQIEIIRLICLLGWKIHLLVADCGAIINAKREEVKAFSQAIQEHAKFRGIHNIEISYLRNYFDVGYPHQKHVINWFHRITADLKVQDLIAINQKKYSKEVKDKLKDNPMIDFLRPALTCAAVLYITEILKKELPNTKTIIIGGEDEKIQWDHAIWNIPGNRLGAIFNPILMESEESGEVYTARQRSDWPIWRSSKDLLRDMENTNAKKWIFQLFVQLPSFPYPYVPPQVVGNDKPISSRMWKKEFEFPSDIEIDDDSLVDTAWPILDPSRRVK